MVAVTPLLGLRHLTGIRQGCPLSPYLLILVTTVIFHDVHNTVWHTIAAYFHDIIQKWELLYAGDTMPMGTRARETNIIMKQIEIESKNITCVLTKENAFT